MHTQRQHIQKQERQLDIRLWLLTLPVFLFSTLVNISSLLMEAAKQGQASPGLTPWITEISSAVVLTALFPFLLWGTRRIPFSSENWIKALLLHFSASLLFSALHVTLMVGMRKLAFTTFADINYQFFSNFWLDSIYEYRKDLGTYLVLVISIYAIRALVEQNRELEAARTNAKATGQLTLKSGARLIRLAAEDFIYAEAAGNYVDVYTTNGHHLVRSSLHALEKQLLSAGIDARRIHRTRIVNSKQVAEISPLGSGDLKLLLQDKTEIRASRRFRNQLAELAETTTA